MNIKVVLTYKYELNVSRSRIFLFSKIHFTCAQLLFNPFFGTLNMVNHVLKPSHLFVRSIGQEKGSIVISKA